MDTIYKGRAPKEDYDKLLEMLNNVFFLEDNEVPKRDFLTLLPKLYKKEYDPCYANFVVKHGETIKGAVGLYPFDYIAAGEKIHIEGIGNVAVARDSRREGHMIDCLNMAVEAAIKNGAALSILGGDRHRYGYFGYEPMGLSYSFNIRERDIRHTGADTGEDCELLPLTEKDTDIIEKINGVLSSLPAYPVREPEKFVDIMKSWHCTPYYVTEKGEFIGWLSINRERSGFGCFKPVKASDWAKLLSAAFTVLETRSAGVSVPVYDKELCNELTKVCGGVNISHSEHFNVFDYEKVIRAYLRVKAQCTPLCDGETVFLIHGVAGDEKLCISVNGGNVNVCKTDAAPDFEFEHREAERLIGSLASERRSELPANIAGWFPLPLFCYGTDGV